MASFLCLLLTIGLVTGCASSPIPIGGNELGTEQEMQRDVEIACVTVFKSHEEARMQISEEMQARCDMAIRRLLRKRLEVGNDLEINP